jgi:hypothetical protein
MSGLLDRGDLTLALLTGLAVLVFVVAAIFAALDADDDEARRLRTLRQSGPWVACAAIAVTLFWAAQPH